MALLQEIKGIIHNIVQMLTRLPYPVAESLGPEGFVRCRAVTDARLHYVVVCRAFVPYF